MIIAKLSDVRYAICAKQSKSPEGALKALGSNLHDDERFYIDLDRLPQHMERLAFVMGFERSSIQAIQQGEVYLSVQNQHLMNFAFKGADFAQEKALIMLELYQKNGWRISATGQGFAAGLTALINHFAGDDKRLLEILSRPGSAHRPPPKESSAPLASAGPVRLNKITLDKSGDKQKLSLLKDDKRPIHINLNWDQKRRGFFGGAGADLDLGCMFMMEDGGAGVIQALGGNFGQRAAYPYIFLDKDDRSGMSQDGENLYLHRPDLIDRVMIFTFIYEGASGFRDVNGRLTLKDQQGNEILVNLDNPNYNRTFCAICTIEKVKEEIIITKQEKYFTGHREADHHFGFGFNWTRGSK
ncbi:MAG: TerD family protein [Deinococcales bacterium]